MDYLRLTVKDFPYTKKTTCRNISKIKENKITKLIVINDKLFNCLICINIVILSYIIVTDLVIVIT